MRRMDRYKDEDTTEVSRRSSKNQELYQTIGTNTRYTNFTDVTNANAYDISKKENTSTREGYQRMKQYNSSYDFAPKERKELDDYNRLMSNNEHKIYDINSVLENARKNKEEVDELDEKRKLQNTSYNILSKSNKKELEAYRKERQERIKKDQEAGIKSIIDKTMAGEINQETTVDLLSDLMATSVLDKVDGSGEMEKVTTTHEITKVDGEKVEEKLKVTTETVEQKEETSALSDTSDITTEASIKEETKQKIDKSKDPDFYTRSMDLSDKDFDMSDDFKEDKVPLGLKIIIFILIIIIVGIAAYIIHQRFM